MKKILLSLIVGLGFTSFAQTDEDIFNASKLYHGGSARFQAMSGAMGAMGADVSAAQINPAANGRFSSNVFSITAGANINSSTSEFVGQTTKANISKFTVPSIHIVLVKDLSRKNKGGVFAQNAFGYNRITNFNQRLIIEGQQFPSLLEGFMGQAAGIEPSNIYNAFPFSTALAYETWALDYDYDEGQYLSYLNEGDMAMKRTYIKTGGVNEFYYNHSRNYMNKLYWGFSLNLRDYKYEQNYVHREMMTVTNNTIFRGFEYQYNLKTQGTGFNGKIGVIYLISDRFRVGASFHTPTFLRLKDNWSANMVTYFADSTKVVQPQNVPEGSYKYRMITPLKVGVSASYQIGMRATINADLDYIAYSMGRLRSSNDPTVTSYNFNLENQNAKERLSQAVNLRIGAEYNIQQKIFIRAGFSMYSPAYKKIELVDNEPDFGYSAGLGYKKNNISIDLAYSGRTMNRTNYLFVNSNTADVTTVANQVVFTFNIHF